MTWNEIRLRRLFTASGGSWGVGPGEGEVQMPCIRAADFDYQRLQTDIGNAPVRDYSASDVRNRAAHKGDLIIEKSGGGEQQPVGRTVLHREVAPVMPTNFAGRLRPSRGDDPRFLCYLMSSLYADGRTKVAIKQTTGIQNLDLGVLFDQAVRVPTLGSQRAIADYLDVETARIDALITKKRSLAGRAEKRLEAVIDRLTVPRALGGVADSDAFSPWRVTAMKRVADFFSDGDWIESPYITTDGIRLIQTGNVQRGYFREQGYRYISAETFASLNCTEVFPGDVLISRLAGPVGCACLAPDLGVRLVASVDVAILRASQRLLAEFLVAYLSSTRHLAEAELQARGTTMQRLSRTQVGEMPVPVPPLDRQREIISEVQRATTWERSLRVALERQIDRLLEHRQALITAAVTGELEIPGTA